MSTTITRKVLNLILAVHHKAIGLEIKQHRSRIAGEWAAVRNQANVVQFEQDRLESQRALAYDVEDESFAAIIALEKEASATPKVY